MRKRRPFIEEGKRNIILSGLIILCLIILCFSILDKSMNSKSSRKNNKIAIVGNGPLTKKEINEINNYNIIFILNTAGYNKKIPIKATHHILRQALWDHSRPESWGFHGWVKEKNEFTLHPVQKESIKNIIFACPTNKESYVNINKIKRKFKNKKFEVISSGSEPWKEKKYKVNNILYDHNRSPSTGIIGINYILERYPYSEVHIYGMNSRQEGHHNTKREKEYISKCPRCILHKTWKNTYKP